MRNPITSMWGKIWKYASGHRKLLILYVLLSLFANVIILFEPYVFGKLLASIQNGGDDLKNKVIFYLIILAVLPAAFWGFHGISRVIEKSVAYKIQVNYDESALQALFGLPVQWHRKNHSGKNIDKFKRASRGLYEFSSEIFTLVEMSVALIGSFIMLYFVEAYIGIVTSLVAVIAFLTVIIFDIFLYKQYQRLNAFYNKVASIAFDYISNVFTVLTMRFEKTAIKEYKKKYFEPYSLYKKNVIINECKWASVTLIITVMTIGILAWEVLSKLNANEVIVIGSLYTIYAYLDRIGHNFYQFAWKYSQIVEQDASVASAENIFRDYKRLGTKASAPVPSKWGKIKIKGLHFTYEDEKKLKHQIKDINFDIQKGEKIAFVGESGCGKSTVLGLLRGIYNASHGEVIVDGKKMSKGLDHLSNVTTLMPQEPELFENTIRYNVSMGVSFKKEEIMKVLKWARFANVLKKLPDGLNTDIAEKGVNLSGGEKQRLALARGLLAATSSDIILMDEPTSSVDMKNEQLIFQNIFKQYYSKTIIASVHRLNLLPMFDTVVYFESGKISKIVQQKRS